MPTPVPAAFSRTSPVTFLMTIGFSNWVGFACWQALINNFGKDAGFTGFDIGLMQSVREIPGFLAFTAIILFLIMREQLLAYLSLLMLGFGIALTGFYPSLTGILITTFIMSVGFHYFETSQQALSLQVIPKEHAAQALGKVASAVAMAQLMSFGAVALAWHLFQPSWQVLFLWAGGVTVLLTAAAWAFFPRFQGSVPQNKGLVLRRRYRLELREQLGAMLWQRLEAWGKQDPASLQTQAELVALWGIKAAGSVLPYLLAADAKKGDQMASAIVDAAQKIKAGLL
jgi:hypothetical protein